MVDYRELRIERGGIAKNDYEVVKNAYTTGVYTEDQATFFQVLYLTYVATFPEGISKFATNKSKYSLTMMEHQFLEQVALLPFKKSNYDIAMMASCVTTNGTKIRNSFPVFKTPKPLTLPEEFKLILRHYDVNGLFAIIDAVRLYKQIN